MRDLAHLKELGMCRHGKGPCTHTSRSQTANNTTHLPQGIDDLVHRLFHPFPAALKTAHTARCSLPQRLKWGTH